MADWQTMLEYVGGRGFLLEYRRKRMCERGLTLNRVFNTPRRCSEGSGEAVGE